MDTIIFHGNIGKDAEYTEKDGRGMAKFSVAVTHRNKGEKTTEWRNVTVFGKTAEICRDYAKKGRTVLIEGRPTAHGYKNKLEEIVASIDVLADRVDLIGGGRDGDAPSGQAPAGFVQVNEAEMPF
jgi:single-strand DNA-binding protein